MNQLPTLSQRISTLSYTPESLTRIFLLLNNNLSKLPQKKKPAIYLTGGYAKCTYKNGGRTYVTGPTANSYLYMAHFDDSYQQQLGAEVVVVKRRISVLFGLHYQHSSFHGEVENVSAYAKLNFLAPTASLEYPFNKNAVQFHLGVQIGSPILLNRTATKAVFVHNTAGTWELNGEPSLRGGFIIYGGYAGLTLGKIKLDATIIQSPNMLDVPAYLKALAVGIRIRYLVIKP